MFKTSIINLAFIFFVCNAAADASFFDISHNAASTDCIRYEDDIDHKKHDASLELLQPVDYEPICPPIAIKSLTGYADRSVKIPDQDNPSVYHDNL